jgi:hypothetical protein
MLLSRRSGPDLRVLVLSLCVFAWLSSPLFAQHGSARAALVPQARDLDQAVASAFGVSSWHEVRVDVPLQAPEQLHIALPVDGVELRFVLSRHSLRSAGFAVRAQLPDRSWQVVALEAPATYRAPLAGPEGGMLLGTLGPLGLSADLFRPGRPVLSLRPLASIVPGLDRARHALIQGLPAELLPTCGQGLAPATALGTPVPGPGADPGPGLYSTGLTGVSAARGKGPGPCLALTEIAFDADFEYFQLKGSSVPAVVATIESHMNQVDYFYARDSAITYELTQIVVRTAPFYTPIDGGDLLNQFRAEWNSNQAGVPRDLAHLMTAKPGSVIQYGGLAWVGVVCNLGLAYGWSLDSAGIIGHEVGHNWNAPHCLDPSPCNSMCGACLYHGPNTKAVIEAWRDAATCLDSKIFYPTPLPPYVLSESLSIGKDEYATALPAGFDVLANDDDGNCDELSVASFDAQSDQGGTVTLVEGAGGQDTLFYTPPADLFVGHDGFDYVVGDGSSAGSSGRVDIDVDPLRMLGWWSLDDALGSTATDLSDGQLHGDLQGPMWTLGAFGGALAFDGVDDQVVLPAMNGKGGAMTLSAWVRRDGSQTNGAGLIICRDGGTNSGLHFGAFNELRYTWANSIQSLLFNPGFTLPDGAWVFVAVVVEPDRATLYLGDATTLQSASNATFHFSQDFAGDTKLGVDPFVAGRFFAGDMDEVRIWDHALASDEVDALWRLGGRAELPYPADGGLAPDATAALRWVPGLGADSHDVYVGTGFAAVSNATPVSPEYVGNVTAPLFVTPQLAQATTWYWRVDERVGVDVAVGEVWQLRVADNGHWSLDDLSGSTAVDVQGNFHGSYVGNPGLGKLAATPFTGTAVRFDGNNDAVNLPALDLNSDEVTLTLWVRRIGDQSDWAGLLFSRAGGTVAGLNFGTDNELRYHWNGAGDTYGFDSQLILPDATWVFCALVVRPDRAVLYAGIDGAALVSATNAVAHGPEEWDGAAWLGQDPTGGRWFNGRLDEPRVFNRALSEKELRQIYEDALNGVP